MSSIQFILTIAVCAAATMLTRFLPFLVFGSRGGKVPEVVEYLGHVLPAAIFGMLIVYCLEGFSLTSGSHGIPEAIAIGVTVALHKWMHQTLVSIAGGTLCYVLLGFVQVDYGWRGLTFILILYMARGSRGGLAAAYLAYALFWGSTSSQVNSLFGYSLTFLTWDGLGPVLAAFFRLQGMIWLSLPLILCPTRTGLRLPGRLGYWLSPIHLVVLILIRLMTGTGFDVLVRGF